MLSILNQDYPNLEYIVVDGGSNDGSIEVIRKYETRLAYWVSEPDKGQSDAINKGFAKATGSILGWINSDDLLMPGAVSAAVKYLQKHPSIGCIVGDLRVIGPAGEHLFDRKSISVKWNRLLYGGWIVPQQTTFYTRAALEAALPLDCSLQYQMDYDFFLRMKLRGVRFATIPFLLAGYRLHAMAKTVSQHQNKVEQANYTIRRRYSHIWLGSDRRTAAAFRILKRVYRLQAYLVRVFTRGDFVPWRGVRAIRSLAEGKYVHS
jgi:glycosyltransferase involved in cell wall biosynthesis